MAIYPSQQITEIVVLRPKHGVNLDNVTATHSEPAKQSFIQLTNILKTQEGFIRQFWGHEVEHPDLFCWAIEWESFEHQTTFINSIAGTSFTKNLNQIFDLEKSAPVTVFTHVPDIAGATAAFRSPVTEVAFYTMSTRPNAETRANFDKSCLSVIDEVQAIGKATGAAIGWVFDAIPRSIATGADSVAIYGVFGYANIDVHMEWRETPEGKKNGEPTEGIDPAVVVPGIDPVTGYFHVHFQEGV